jgi:hypothetical protein
MTVGLLTCSFRGDHELFVSLCESADRLVAPTMPHLVLVPRRDLPLFRAFARPGRNVVALEAFLPRWTWRLPLAKGRREVFRVPGAGRIGGWTMQQLLKIEAARRLIWEVVVHVDSDVVFVRPIAEDALVERGRTRLKRVPGATRPATHLAWHRTALQLLGLPEQHLNADYIDNLVTWRPATVRMLTDYVERVTGQRWQTALARAPTLSEYVLYGLFCEHVGGEAAGHCATEHSLCHTLWTMPQGSDDGFLAEWVERLEPHHLACAIQSTIPIPAATRRALQSRADAIVRAADERVDRRVCDHS